ncbi:DNA cytosine methyltransferase [Dermacoccus nishinomiyaensis]|uniref:DNA cytosine methyltransferase n=1 Tax=Dermacoccus nishinomiyaensis TaxID=1274 RepID=UPI001EF70B57|nr:DNA cytosine methyltransferase [Dermacoccus nishinomiyaensis]MCG7429089.1 DNA cytosine methyltransferase [Dermacoccus nishinomiyaensis]
MPITTLDLFAGAGGLTAGFHAASADFVTTRAIEMDADAVATFNANHGKGVAKAVPIESWLESDEPEELRAEGLDVIVGGPPCQGFSALGKRDVDDARNTLWEHYATTIRRTNAKYFVVENVASFLSSPQFQAFRAETVDGSLKDWTFEAKVLNAADFGAPQARKRAVLLGHRSDVAPFEFPEPTHDRLGRNGLARWVDVRTAFAADRAARRAAIPARAHTTWPGPARGVGGPFRTSELHADRTYTTLSKERFANIPAGGNRFDIPDHLLSPCWKKHTAGSADVMGRLHWDRPSVTIRTEFFKPEKGRYLHPEAHRAITHWEAARLQGFPDDYRWHGTRSSIARQIGNAVPLVLGAALGRRLPPEGI